MKSEFTVGVLGLGHVGLPTAVGFAELGWSVLGWDDLAEKTGLIREKIAPFYEPGLQELLDSAITSQRLVVTKNVEEIIKKSDVLFVCVGTPQNEDGSADLSQIEKVARDIARYAETDKLVVEKSTTPVSTAKSLKETLDRYKNSKINIDVAVNPEFLREGTGIKDFFNPDRIVIGVETEKSRKILQQLYEPLAKKLKNQVDDGKEIFVVTDLNTAELIKHASNSFLAMKISFINTVSDICDEVGADVVKVAHGMGMDPRIGSSFLNAGIGFGGYCLPKDINAFSKIGEDFGVDMSIFRAVSRINDKRYESVINKLKSALSVLRDKKVAVWGLSFKPETDDVREAPSIVIIKAMIEEGMTVRLHDPEAIEQFKEVISPKFGLVEYYDSPEDACMGADCILILTEWKQYLDVDLASVRQSMINPLLIDGRNMFDPVKVSRSGFQYFGMGRT